MFLFLFSLVLFLVQGRRVRARVLTVQRVSKQGIRTRQNKPLTNSLRDIPFLVVFVITLSRPFLYKNRGDC